MKAIDRFIQAESRGPGRRAAAARGPRFTVQMGCHGADGEAAVRAIVELGRRQKAGKRLGATAVIKAERR